MDRESVGFSASLFTQTRRAGYRGLETEPRLDIWHRWLQCHQTNCVFWFSQTTILFVLTSEIFIVPAKPSELESYKKKRSEEDWGTSQVM